MKQNQKETMTAGIQGFDLKRPCGLCPFRSDENSIRFASETRALEIALTALIHGFPCHKTAEYVESDEYNGADGYVFGESSQHCAGYLIMKLNEDCTLLWPGIGDNDEILEHIRTNLDMTAPVFADTNEFVRANTRRDGH